jgi:hypothetical protein
VSKTRLQIALISLLALLGSLTVGCPDPESQYEEFLDATADSRASGDASTGAGVVTDFSGTHFLALSTNLAPGFPLYFLTTVTVDTEAATIDLSFQPLTVDTNEAPRTPVGDPILVEDVVFEEDGTFVADMGEVEAPGESNPLSGSDIRATLVLSGRVDSETFFCGIVSGNISEPLESPLDGSTFAAVAATLEEAAEIETVVFECPEEEPEGTGEGAE